MGKTVLACFTGLLVSTSVLATESTPTKPKIECRFGFVVESMDVHGLSDDDVTLRGKTEFGILHQPDYKVPGFDTVAYANIDVNDPVFFVLKDAYLKKLEFEVCTDKSVVDEMDRDGICSHCTARGEIQGLIRITKVALLTEKQTAASEAKRNANAKKLQREKTGRSTK